MDPDQTTAEPVEEPAGFDPRHFFATPDNRVDMNAVKPHACMRNIRQIGNYIHCYDGNHGMRLAADEQLVQENGQFVIKKLTIVKTDKKGRVID